MILDRTVSLTYENERGFSIPLTPYVKDPINGVFFVLTNDETLPTDIFSERQVGWHGEQLQAFFVGSRRIDIDGFIRWDTNNTDLIHRYKRTLERAFNPTVKGTLTFSRSGNLESFYLQNCILDSAPTLRVHDGVLGFSVTIRAHEPFWQQKSELVRLSFTQKNIYFPLSIRPKQYIGGVVPRENKTYFGLKRRNLSTAVNNIGDVETGFRVVFIANGEVRNPSFTNLDTNRTIKLLGNPGDFIMEKGDEVEISSYPDRKEILVHGGERGFRYLDPDNKKFFFLPMGTTNIAFNADLNAINLDVLLYYAPSMLGAEN